jgi:hypothetical protein
MTFRLKRKKSGLWNLILLGIVIPLFLLPFIHYHPETNHSHNEHANAHQHEGYYHSATLEAYAHLVSGHFSDRELDDHFHHSHSSEDYNENDSDAFTLAKSLKSVKQDQVFKQIGHFLPVKYSDPLVSFAIISETENLLLQTGSSPHSSRAPPVLFL